jgi:hypothetical protein
VSSRHHTRPPIATKITAGVYAGQTAAFWGMMYGSVRLASIPGAVIQLKPGALDGNAYGRDLGRCQQPSGRLQAGFNRADMLDRRNLQGMPRSRGWRLHHCPVSSRDSR